LLVPKTFEGEISATYNPDTMTACSRCEGGFMSKVQEDISKISSNITSSNRGIRSWKEAWGLITGAMGQSIYTQEEDIVMRRYLSSQ